MEEVRLHGMWASTYSKRVELALKIKGIPFEYVEEDLRNKSQALLELNPVHKKVPVLVHNGRTISESLVLLEYIDEVWADHSPRLIPDDPYQRAMVRFWSSFLQIQVIESALKLITTRGEEQEKAMKEWQEKLTLMEEHMGDHLPRDGNRSLGLLDIQLIAIMGAYKAHEEFLGVKTLDPEKHPLIHSWVTSLMDNPLIRDSIPPHEKLVNFLQIVFKVGS